MSKEIFWPFASLDQKYSPSGEKEKRVPFLTCSVPNLSLNGFAINNDGFNLELNSNSSF